eukprot:8242027-Alexandrium_andersonii.AAC.1
MTSTLVSEALEGCVLSAVSRRSRIHRRTWPAGAPEALLGGVRGGGAFPCAELLEVRMATTPHERLLGTISL